MEVPDGDFSFRRKSHMENLVNNFIRSTMNVKASSDDSASESTRAPRIGVDGKKLQSLQPKYKICVDNCDPFKQCVNLGRKNY